MSPRKATPKPAKRAARTTRVARDLEPRQITDAREMRALAHPVRLALLEALVREGPLTATEAAELLGESPANCSFHLRTLAKYGFVEEAEAPSGRARPWRRVALGQSFDMDYDDPEASIAAHALGDVSEERLFERLREWSASRGDYAPEWRRAAFTSNMVLYVTADELRDLGNELLEILVRYRERTLDLSKRPEGSAPVALVTFGHPLRPSPSGN